MDLFFSNNIKNNIISLDKRETNHSINVLRKIYTFSVLNKTSRINSVKKIKILKEYKKS